MGTVVIAAQTYNIYGTQAAAIVYHNGSYKPASVAWLAATADTQARTLVDATRILDEVSWAGVRTDPTTPQPLAWPRTGVTYADGTAISSTVTPVEIDEACYELAALVLAKPGVADASTQDSNIESVTAGSVNVSFFAPVRIGMFPHSVMRLIRQFLGSSSGLAAGSERLGDCNESAFDDCDRLRRW